MKYYTIYETKSYKKEFLNDMFLSIVSPFGYFQPYKPSKGIESSENNSLNEMFIGREDELSCIKNFENKMHIVYGGRQLGKSSLLQKATRDINEEDNNDRAVYIQLKRRKVNEDSKSYDKNVLEQIIDKLKGVKIFDENIQIDNWDNFGNEIKKVLESDEKNISSLALFIDEVDDFFEICDEDNNDASFDVFSNIAKDVSDNLKKNFKVVFAGLNMIRDYKFNGGNNFGAQLSGKNYVLIKPFNDEDAIKLIEKPLRYLGLYVLPEEKSLIYLILDKSNYYPCLIQAYCENLLKVMCRDNYARYSPNTSPIYYIHKDHIKDVLADKDCENDIWTKFEATLKLNPTLSSTGTKEDGIYKYLAYILAFLCHSKGYDSYSISDFVDIAKNNKIKHICELYDKKDENGKSKLDIYIDHLVDLSVFNRKEEQKGKVKKYSFRRLQLFQLLENNVDIDKVILSFNS